MLVATRLAPFLWIAILASGLAAGSFQWQVPDRGAVEYRRETITWQVTPVDTSREGVQRAVDGSSEWRVRTWPGPPAADGFQMADFDAGGWSATRLPLIASNGAGSVWPESARSLDARTVFRMPIRRVRTAVLSVRHADDVRVWLNGVEILAQAANGDRRSEHAFGPDELKLFDRRDNVLSCQLRGTDAGSRLEVELSVASREFAGAEQALERVARDRGDASRIEGSLFSRWRAPAFLCQGQLDEDRERVPTPPVDLRDLGAWLAFDIDTARSGGRIDGLLRRIWRFGDVAVKGRAERPGDDGSQHIECDVVGIQPDIGADDKSYYQSQVLRWWDYTLEGTVRVSRQVDLDAGVVRSLESELTARITVARGDQAGRSYDMVFAERWDLREVRANRDARFKADVVQAISEGAAFLREQLKNTGRRELRAGGDNRTYPSGRLALAILAMVHAEVPRDDEVLVKAIEDLRQRDLVDTYSLANAIMAIEAYNAPRGEYEELRMGRIDKPRERRLPDADREAVARWAAKLLQNVDTRVDVEELARWSYLREGRYDQSVNQYGLLGLHSAKLCGIEVPPRIWAAAAAHLVDVQQRPLERMRLQVTSHIQLRNLERNGGGTTSTGGRVVGIGGWGYHEAEHNGVARPIYGSMTCAGLTGLAIALAGMRDTRMARPIEVSEAENALFSGFAWLSRNFSVMWHPGPGLHAGYFTHIYYYLYGLERACELSGVALLNGRDWYFEGALALLAQRKPDKSFDDFTGGDYGAITTTAMAILFLKKASLPVYSAGGD